MGTRRLSRAVHVSCVRSELTDAFTAAQHLGRLKKALDWQRVFDLLGRDNLAAFADYPASWIWLFLHFPRDDL